MEGLGGGHIRHGRARAIPWQESVGQRSRSIPWWGWALVAAGVIAAMPGWAQVQTSPVPDVQGPAQGSAPQGQVPEVIRPGGSASSTQPRGDNPLVSPGSRPVPDRGVIAPPPSAGGTTPVIRPPVAGSMPVIPPPGSAGGPAGVVPK